MPFKCVVPGCKSNYYHKRGTPSVPMLRFPDERDLVEQWCRAIARPDFRPSVHSHVCIKHFRYDQLVWHEYRKRVDGMFQRVRRRSAKLRPSAVPSLFAVDPARHPVRPCNRERRPKPLISTPATTAEPCELLKGYQVKFKPEMWQDNDKNSEGEPQGKNAKPKSKTTTNRDLFVKSEMIPCSALACTNTSESFIMNCLPRDPALRQIWVNKIDRLDWTPEPDSALCEIHFEPEMWDSDVGEEKILRNDAVPTMFLHGEAIKSWVTMDNTGNVENIVVGSEANEDEDMVEEVEDEGNDSSSDRDDFGEVLEPEIDMVEGSEEVLSQDASSTEDFETIYCDTTVHDDQEGFAVTKEEPDSILPDQDEEVTCLDDSPEMENGEDNDDSSSLWMSHMVNGRKGNFKNSLNFKKRLKRRSSCQLPEDFQCPICDRRLSRRKNLELHIEKLHPNGEMSEYQKKRKLEELRAKEEEAMRAQKARQFKKPPPALRPIVPKCLLTPSASSILAQPAHPVVSSTTLSVSRPPATTPSSTSVPTSLATTSNGGALVTQSMLDPPSAPGVDSRKQFLLLLPKGASLPLPPPPPPEQPPSSTDESDVFSVNLCHIPLEKRFILKAKLREFVDAVVTKNLNPNKIIIAYDRT